MWRQYPALPPGIAFLLGCLAALQGCQGIWVSVAFVLIPLGVVGGWRRAGYWISFLLFAYVYTTLTCLPTPQDHMNGIARVQFYNIRESPLSRGGGWTYQGEVIQFQLNDQVLARRIPVTLHVKKGEPRPSGGQQYWIGGVLKKGRGSHYRLKANSPHYWQAIPYTFSLAECRYRARCGFHKWLSKQVHRPIVGEFLSGLSTGNLQNRELLMDFQRVGLRHILAISGFHFALISLFISWILRPWIEIRMASALQLLLLTGYFFLFSTGPSMQRAWIMLSLHLIAQIKGWASQPLNLLGTTLILILVDNPRVVEDIGFQFSFLATASILFLYRPLDHILKAAFRGRRVAEILQLHASHQVLYVCMVNLRRGLALSLAVHSFTLPLALYHFHSFPLLSWLFNLFFPFLVSISLFLLLTSCTLFWFPPLCQVIMSLNSRYTHYLLGLVHHTSPNWDFVLRVESFHPLLLQGCLLTLGYAAIWAWHEGQAKNEEPCSWVI